MGFCLIIIEFVFSYIFLAFLSYIFVGSLFITMYSRRMSVVTFIAISGT